MNLCWYVQSCLSSTWFKCSGCGTSYNIWGKLVLITAKKDGKGNCISGDYLLLFGFCFLVCPHYWAIHVLWEHIGNEYLGWFCFLSFFIHKMWLTAKMHMGRYLWLCICLWKHWLESLEREDLGQLCEALVSNPFAAAVFLIENCVKLCSTSKFLFHMGVSIISSLLLEKELSGEGKESSTTFIGVN